MQTARLTSKGQLVIPKSVREALHLQAGTDFEVSIEGTRIVLEAKSRKNSRLQGWPGLNPKKVRLSAGELCAPVTDYKDA